MFKDLFNIICFLDLDEQKVLIANYAYLKCIYTYYTQEKMSIRISLTTNSKKERFK